MSVGAKVPANAISQSAGDDETEVASRRAMNIAMEMVLMTTKPSMLTEPVSRYLR
jgi:hypothetical protein